MRLSKAWKGVSVGREPGRGDPRLELRRWLRLCQNGFSQNCYGLFPNPEIPRTRVFSQTRVYPGIPTTPACRSGDLLVDACHEHLRCSCARGGSNLALLGVTLNDSEPGSGQNLASNMASELL
jgi:hypothetical protein